MNDKKKRYVLIGIIAAIVVIGIVLGVVLMGSQGGNAGVNGDQGQTTTGAENGENAIDGTGDNANGGDAGEGAADATGDGSEEDAQGEGSTAVKPSIGVEIEEAGDIDVEISDSEASEGATEEPTNGGASIDFDDLLKGLQDNG